MKPVADTTADRGPIMLRIDPAVRHQRFEGWGTSLAWWGHLVGTAHPELRERLAEDLFSTRGDGLGLSVVRYNIGAGENPSFSPTMELRARVPGWKSAPTGSLRAEADAGQMAVLADAVDAIRRSGGQVHLETFANSPPWWMTVSGTVTGALGPDGAPSDNLREDAVAEFAEYLAAVTDLVEREIGVPVETISPFNEPSSTWWRPGGRQEGSAYTRPMMSRVISAVAEVTGGRRGIGVAEEWDLADSVKTWDSFDDDVRGTLSAFNAHTYAGDQRAALRARLEGACVPLYVSEYGDGDPTGLSSARTMLRDLRELRTPRWVTWQAVGPDMWGYLRLSSSGALARIRKRSVTAQFTRFVRPGWELVGVDCPWAVAALSPGNEQLVVVAVNDRPSEVEFDLDLSRFVSAEAQGRWDTDMTRGPGRELAEGPAAVRSDMVRVEMQPLSIATLRFSVRVDLSAAGPVSGSGRVRVVHAESGKVATVSQPVGDFVPGGSVVAASVRPGDPRQHFDIEACGDDASRLISASTGHVLDAQGALTDAATPIVTWWAAAAEATPSNARWHLAPAGGDLVRLRGVQSGRDVVVAAAGPHGVSAGSSLVLGERLDPSGLWRLERIDDLRTSDG